MSSGASGGGGARHAVPMTPRTPVATVADSVRSIAPGLAAAIGVAIVARVVTGSLPAAIANVVAEVTVAILFGIAIAALAGSRMEPLAAGLSFASRRVLRLGIILLGARLSLGEIARIGLPATVVIVITMTVSFAVVLLVARLVRVESTLAVLIAVGSAVCGNTAIVATAPVIGARPRDVAYAVATITLFGTLCVVLYPAIGRALAMPQPAFGLWAGVAVHDTSQVLATSGAYGPAAQDVATVVKLIRNAMMAPLLFLIATGWAARGTDAVGSARRGVRGAIPLFVLGFLALAALRTAGVIGADQAAILDVAARALILVALAAVGMSIRIGELRETSWRPLAVGFAVALVVGIGSLAAIQTLGLAAAIGV